MRERQTQRAFSAKARWIPKSARGILCLYAGFALGLACELGCGQTGAHRAAQPPIESSAVAVAAGATATTFCGDCHAPPLAASFPKDAWPEEVERGYQFYFDSQRTDLMPPRQAEIVDYYRALAPHKLELHPAAPTATDLKFLVTSTEIARSSGGASVPAVSHLRWLNLDESRASCLISCDMRAGELRRATPAPGGFTTSLLASVAHPAHVEPCDLDGDGKLELVVADLGSFLPADHDLGKVVWLKPRADGTGIEPVDLLTGLGRVADVRPGDFDGDGDVDLIVGEFGWHATGRILLLENVAAKSATPKFAVHVLDKRHGTIHVPPCDLNGDGRLDFVALISQEHEKVEAFLNLGNGKFECRTIYAAPDPAYGSSGIELDDLDQDGDLDVLYTNGDTFDSFYLKPYHSIQWLENRGAFPFVKHHLAYMPGVHRALAGDLDGDGDLDVVAVAMIPEERLLNRPQSHLDSVLWLEQVRAGEFVARSLQQDALRHVALELADFDGDGDLDLAIGNFSGGRQQTGLPWFEIWWNDRIHPNR